MKYYVFRLWSTVQQCTNPDCGKIYRNHLELQNGAFLPPANVGQDGHLKCIACRPKPNSISGWSIKQKEGKYELSKYEKPVNCVHCGKQHVVVHNASGAGVRQTQDLTLLTELCSKAQATDENGIFKCWDCEKANIVLQIVEEYYVESAEQH